LNLCAPFAAKEIKAVMFSISNTKSPGQMVLAVDFLRQHGI